MFFLQGPVSAVGFIVSLLVFLMTLRHFPNTFFYYKVTMLLMGLYKMFYSAGIPIADWAWQNRFINESMYSEEVTHLLYSIGSSGFVVFFPLTASQPMIFYLCLETNSWNKFHKRMMLGFSLVSPIATGILWSLLMYLHLDNMMAFEPPGRNPFNLLFLQTMWPCFLVAILSTIPGFGYFWKLQNFIPSSKSVRSFTMMKFTLNVYTALIIQIFLVMVFFLLVPFAYLLLIKFDSLETVRDTFFMSAILFFPTASSLTMLLVIKPLNAPIKKRLNCCKSKSNVVNPNPAGRSVTMF